jgi:glutathione S-transferase
MRYTIVIGNKNYSSWSMRPWLVLDHFGFEFDEELIPLDEEDTRARILAYSPAGQVPVLVHRSFAVWDSLAIIEYLAEVQPDAGIWPQDMQQRAIARSLAAEIHSGYRALRAACPMNLRKTFRFRRRGGVGAEKEVERFEAMVRDRTTRSGGPFLFGEFTAADAMFAPVVARLVGYGWPLAPETRTYAEAMQNLPSFRRWKEAALEETWVVAADEVR